MKQYKDGEYTDKVNPEREIQIYMDMLRDKIRKHNAIAELYWSIPSKDAEQYQDMIDGLPDADMDAHELLKWAIMQAVHGMESEDIAMRDYVKKYEYEDEPLDCMIFTDDGIIIHHPDPYMD